MIDLTAFDYDLPDAQIAQAPAAHRSESRTLFVRRGEPGIEEGHFGELADRLTGDECLVVNDTRVIPARLRARRRSGARIEVFLLRCDGDPSRPDSIWRAWVSPAKKVRPPEELLLEEDPSQSISVRARHGTFFEVQIPSIEWLWERGETPLPPYIQREAGAARATDDRERYQTLFARTPGAVAAPTAGLHFSQPLLDRVSALGIPIARVTLHVGPGTFKPITADRLEEHRVDPELYEVTRENRSILARARADGRSIVAVGTTSTRTLETLASLDAGPTITGETDLTILPGHRFRNVDGLITNFHLPRSSLLVLVSAFHGLEPTLAAYRYAVDRGLRFYSYGDAMVILPRREDHESGTRC